MKATLTYVIIAAWWAGSVSAMALKAGDAVPDVGVPSTSGEVVNLHQQGGSWRVLFFYPKAFTPGCTSQACGMRDSFQELVDLGVTVLGVSTDNVKTQQEFKEKHRLPYDLLADHEKALGRAFDALGMIGMSKRMTFIINPEGIITDVIDSVSVGTHDQDVIKRLKQRMGKNE